MGTLFYAENEATGESYELGKGGWVRLADDLGYIDATDQDRLVALCVEEMQPPVWEDMTEKDRREYAESIVRGLAGVGVRLRLRSDMEWDFNPTVVGSRYP